jgi:hypothetical protein
MTIDEYFMEHAVPFSRTQYFRYKRRILSGREPKLAPRFSLKKIGEREKIFLKGVVSSGNIPPLNQLCALIESEFGTSISIASMYRAINLLFPEYRRCKVGRPRKRGPGISINSLGGFELIIAVAYYLGWPARVTSVISSNVHKRKK